MGLGMRPLMNFYTPPRWATNASVTTEPTEARKNTGASPDEKPPAKEWNWLLNAQYEHIQRINASVVFNWGLGQALSDTDDANWIAYLPSIATWIAGAHTADDVYASVDGVNWTTGAISAPSQSTLTDITGIDSTRVIVCRSTTGGLLYSTNGSSWSTDTVTGMGGAPSAICTKYPDSDYIIAGSDNGEIYIASGGVATAWTVATTPPSGAGVIQSICRLATNTFVCIDDGGYSFKSTDGGDTWAATTTDPRDVETLGPNVVMAANADDQYLVAVGSDPGGGPDATAAYSDDGGDTWYSSTILTDDQAGSNTALNAVYYCGGKIWVAVGDKLAGTMFNILVSYDNGVTFRTALINEVFATGGKDLYAIGCDGKRIVTVGEDWANLHSLGLPGAEQG